MTRATGIRGFCRQLGLLAMLLGTAMVPVVALAQHAMGPGAGSSAVTLESLPADDEVLPAAPADLVLRFSAYVRLVKLTLKSPGGDPLDIGFRYSPDASRVFFHDLPLLPEADYYTVEWAIIDPANQVARGSFNFSFGPDARPPSGLIPVPEVLEHVTVPDFRLLDQGI